MRYQVTYSLGLPYGENVLAANLFSSCNLIMQEYRTNDYCIVSCIRRTFFHGGEYQKSGVRLIYEYSKTRHLFLVSHGAECYRHSFPTLKTHPTFILNVIRSQRLPQFISERKGKHPTFVLASYGAECYRNSFRNVKANTQHLF